MDPMAELAVQGMTRAQALAVFEDLAAMHAAESVLN